MGTHFKKISQRIYPDFLQTIIDMVLYHHIIGFNAAGCICANMRMNAITPKINV
jgi:hypothetical protein